MCTEHVSVRPNKALFFKLEIGFLEISKYLRFRLLKAPLLICLRFVLNNNRYFKLGRPSKIPV